MTLKIGTLVAIALSAATMSAASPATVQDIYSSTGVGTLANGTQVAYSFGSWHAGETDSDISLFSPLFDAMMSQSETSGIGAVCAEIEGIEVSWNDVEQVITVTCDYDKLGHVSVLVADINGANRGIVPVNSNPTQIQLSNIVSGAYVVAVAVDGKLIKTFKIYLK